MCPILGILSNFTTQSSFTIQGLQNTAYLTPFCIQGVSHFWIITVTFWEHLEQAQVIEQHVAIKPCKILSYVHTLAQSNLLCSPFGPCPAKRTDRSGPKSIALVSSYKRRNPANFIPCATAKTHFLDYLINQVDESPRKFIRRNAPYNRTCP